MLLRRRYWFSPLTLERPMRTSRSLLGVTVAIAIAAAAQACGDSPTEPRTPVVVSLTVTPPTPGPGGQVLITATATPPSGQALRDLRLEVSGATTFKDSVLASSDGSVTLQRQVSMALATGEVHVLARATTKQGSSGSNETTITLADPTAPTWDAVTTTPSTNATPLEPGDTLKVQLFVSDDISLRYTVVRVAGAVTRTDSVAYNGQTPYAQPVAAIPIPSNAPLDGTVTVTAVAMDIGGNVITRNVGTFTIRDLLAPSSGLTVSGARPNGAFFPGDTATLTISATDNRALRAYGYAVSGIGIRDSVSASGTSAQRVVRLPLISAGTYSVTVFATDSAQNHVELLGGVLTVASRSRRPIMSVSLGGAYDIAYESKRNRIYVSQPDSAQIAVVAADAVSRLSSFSVSNGRPTGIDVTLGGDTLVVGLTGSLNLGFIDLNNGAMSTQAVITDTFLSRTPSGVRVAANNRVIFGVTFAGSGYGGSITEFDLATRTLGSSVTTTESLPMAVSGNRQRVYALMDDSCCPEDGIYYDATKGKFSGTRGVISSYGPGIATDFTGARALFGYVLTDANMLPITTFSSRSQNPVALSLDGTYAFFGTSTGIDKVRTSDNVTVESFDIGGQPTHLRLLPDGLTLVATTGTTLYVIDLW
jgi:hypothetical protein